MGEMKSVKVDNWGVLFLQKLQNFFNKADYCDLTLQFRDNSQLKVHRLVLSACTDYFNVLEQTCDIIDDALIMPNELQADVVVPIVDFMYTGTLEFELKMYSKLLRTAKEMNMTVLLKLLEAHRRTMEGTNRSQRPPSPKTSPAQQQYQQQQQTTSPFEQLRKGYSNNKRPTTATFVSPPAKKPNIEYVEEFADHERIRKHIAAEYGDDAEYITILDDDIHNDDDDDDKTKPTVGAQLTRATGQTATTVVKTQQQQQQPTTTKTFTQDPDEKTPTNVVKDSSNSKIDHDKIISDVLRQYPHLKITPKVSGQGHRIIVKKVPSGQLIDQATPRQQIITKTEMLKPGINVTKTVVPEVIGATTIKPLPLKPIIVGATTLSTGTTATGVAGLKPTITNDGKKRQIDGKTMQALVSLLKNKLSKKQTNAIHHFDSKFMRNP